MIRRARLDDIDWILSQLKIFAKWYGTKKSLYGDETYCREGLRKTIENHYFTIAEQSSEPIGFISGYISPHPYNPSIRVLTEFFWWVSENKRHTKAGSMLLDEYVRWGKENCDWVTFSVTQETKISENHLTKRGFMLIEKSYLLEA